MRTWDDVVDVVCVGGGIAGIASAIATVDVGADVYLALPGSVRPDETVSSIPPPAQPWYGLGITDRETVEYLTALVDDVGPAKVPGDADIPVRVVVPPPPSEPGRRVAPFIGSRLRDWAARCLGSPYGWLYTRVAEREMTPTHTLDGETIEIHLIGDLPPGEVSGRAVVEWLNDEASDRGIEAHPHQRLQRFVFEDGDVVGVVLATPRGPWTIRARHGVTVTTSGPIGDRAGGPIGDRAGGSQSGHFEHHLRVAMVSQAASRFGRLEILTTVPSARGSRKNTTDNGRLPDGRATVTDLGLYARTRRESNRNPPFGQ